MLLEGLPFCLLIYGTRGAAFRDHEVSLRKTKSSVHGENNKMEAEGSFEPLDQPAIEV